MSDQDRNTRKHAWRGVLTCVRRIVAVTGASTDRTTGAVGALVHLELYQMRELLKPIGIHSLRMGTQPRPAAKFGNGATSRRRYTFRCTYSGRWRSPWIRWGPWPSTRLRSRVDGDVPRQGAQHPLPGADKPCQRSCSWVVLAWSQSKPGCDLPGNGSAWLLSSPTRVPPCTLSRWVAGRRGQPPS